MPTRLDPAVASVLLELGASLADKENKASDDSSLVHDRLAFLMY